jgi:hypothetical protein
MTSAIVRISADVARGIARRRSRRAMIVVHGH